VVCRVRKFEWASPFLDLAQDIDYLGDELLNASQRVIRSGSYVLGRQEIRLTVGNGLHALELAL